jgi:hypothetical protein
MAEVARRWQRRVFFNRIALAGSFRLPGHFTSEEWSLANKRTFMP